MLEWMRAECVDTYLLNLSKVAEEDSATVFLDARQGVSILWSTCTLGAPTPIISPLSIHFL